MPFASLGDTDRIRRVQIKFSRIFFSCLVHHNGEGGIGAPMALAHYNIDVPVWFASPNDIEIAK
jgi:hypothetical protein